MLWRIATETREHGANDLSGSGAALYPGRWNTKKAPVVYCALTLSTAVLETAAHIKDGGLPLNRFIVEIDVPPTVWVRREAIDAANLPGGWDAIPSGQASAAFGAKWLQDCSAPILVLPSVIVPREQVALINPNHKLARRITATTGERVEFSRLFR
ncbi:MAG: RES family NAD+ phosphorylase [Burkholderiaceae bacterium]|nr:RES family NAD+ phosphorylase [Burkholderiaceae bacterium]